MDRRHLLGIARHEREALGRTIQYTPPERWDGEVNGTRLRDLVAHLAALDVAAAAVVGGEAPSELEEFAKSEEREPTLERFKAFAVERRAGTDLRQVIVEWGRAADLFLARVSAIPEGEWATRRLPWVVGELPLRYLVQSRVAQWWAYGHDIRIGAELDPRLEHWPIYAVNDLAIRALPWALGLAGLHFHDRSVRVELEGPGGGTWHHALEPGQAPAPNRVPDATIGGRGYPFALVATRREAADDYVDDGTLVVGGDEQLARTVLRNIRVFE